MSDADQVSQGEITRLLIRWRGGDQDALNNLFPLVYDALRALARRQLRGGSDRTLDTTALVHEAYLKLVDQTRATARDRSHFFALTSRAMRHILVDNARRHAADKRGGSLQRVTLGEEAAAVTQAADVLAVDEALVRLEELDARMGRLVEMRFYGGLSVEETAEALDVSPRTVKRDWRKARAFLHRALRGKEPS